MKSISVFVDIAKFADFRWKNSDLSRTRAVSRGSYVFWVFFRLAKFHHCTICITAFREGASLHPPPPSHPWAAMKKPILNRVKLAAYSKLTRDQARKHDSHLWRYSDWRHWCAIISSYLTNLGKPTYMSVTCDHVILVII